jgi:drug/metabolite transporter (DMT)-like permease
MRWLLVLLLACSSVVAQINLKSTAPHLPLSWAQATELGLGHAALLILRAGGLSGLTLLLTWYSYKYFGFLELFVATGLTYVLAVVVSYYLFHEVLTWQRVGGVTLVACGVGLFFIK